MQEHIEYRCEITGQPGDESNMIPVKALSRSMVRKIKQQGHVFHREGFVHAGAVNKLVKMHGIEEEADHLADELEETYQNSLSVGDRLADKIADFGGSWNFIILFLGFIVVWIAINVFQLFNGGFDAYPFILLNLILSCVAAIQAPVIMMSQNRQEDKDRLRAKNDYYINLKAEKEIRELNKKLDELIQLQHAKK